jgi:hypothetical protein
MPFLLGASSDTPVVGGGQRWPRENVTLQVKNSKACERTASLYFWARTRLVERRNYGGVVRLTGACHWAPVAFRSTPAPSGRDPVLALPRYLTCTIFATEGTPLVLTMKSR